MSSVTSAAGDLQVQRRKGVRMGPDTASRGVMRIGNCVIRDAIGQAERALVVAAPQHAAVRRSPT